MIKHDCVIKLSTIFIVLYNGENENTNLIVIVKTAKMTKFANATQNNEAEV